MKPIFAVDCDGVLLSYNDAFGWVYEQHFGVKLTVKDPSAYHATTYWGIENPPRGSSFWQAFTDMDTWAKMPALPGSIEACHELVEMGFEVVCVTSMPTNFEERRLSNLKSLGFPIERVIACGKKVKTDSHAPEAHRPENPKKEAIEDLKPVWFVDDEWRKLQGFDGIHLGMIDPGYSDTPNTHADHTQLRCVMPNLLSLVRWLKQNPTYHPSPSSSSSSSGLKI